MRSALSRRLFVLCLLALTCVACPVSAGQKIEAVKGKHYGLTKKHGPWMIMVASFHAASPDGIVRDGKTPQQLADELVWELRNLKPNGIPAYTYAITAHDEKIRTTDRLGRDETRKFLTNQDHISVIAGNYPAFDDPLAQRTLAYLKKLQPACLQQEGVKYLRTQRRQGPLGAAFLTVNPMLTPEEIRSRQHDPLLAKINAGGKYSLFENPGKYTLVVATFTGKSLTHRGDSNSPEAMKAFQIDVEDNDLANAEQSAWELAVALREREKNIDAYVWHDRYQSFVTVGSFESPNDPRLKPYLQVFAPSPIEQIAASGDQVVFPGAPSERFGIAAGGGNKVYGITGFGENRDQSRLWAFDAKPMMMRVPKLH